MTLGTTFDIPTASATAATTAISSDLIAQAQDPRHGYRSIRYNSNDRERNLAQHRGENLWSHIMPNSVYVAAIGNHWKPGSWQRVMDMVHHTNQYGYKCVLDEIMDRCFNPYDSLGAMRNEAIMRARQGYDWLCYIDNDVFPDPPDLVDLVNHELPIVAPYVAEPSSGKPLHGPHRRKWQGLQPVRWCVLSMLVIRTSVFNGTGCEFWNDSIGADEGYHFQKFWDVGHRPFVDTDIVLPVGNDPTYPLATNRFERQDADEFWNRRKQWLLAIPDRAPINPHDGRVTEFGEYLPFQPPRVPQQAGVNSVRPAPDTARVAALHGGG